MKGAVRLALGGMLISVISVVSASPAIASSGSVSAPAGTLWASGCLTQPYSYAFDMAPGVSQWDLNVTLYTPDGSSSDFDFQTGSGSSGSGSGSFTICSYEGAGAYHIDGQVKGYDDLYSQVDFLSMSGMFVLYQPVSITTFRVNDKTAYFNQVLRFKTTSRYQMRFGWTVHDYVVVALEVYRSGSWHRVRGSKRTTDQYGRASWKYRWNVSRKVRLRATTFGTSEIAGSTSSSLVIR